MLRLLIGWMLCFVVGLNAQNDCSQAIIVCGNSGFSGLEVVGIGTQELVGNHTCQGMEHNSIWLKLPIKTGGTLGFNLIPESTAIEEDFDFYIFGPIADCNALGNTIRCSTTNPMMSNAPNNHTGMNSTETDVAEGPGDQGNNFIQWLTVDAGDSYFLVIDRPIGTSNFSLQWTGTATFEDQPVVQTLDADALRIEHCETLQPAAYDLTVNDAAIIGSQTGVDLTYHTSTTDLLTGGNAIPDPANYVSTSNPQTIYARLTNAATGCFVTTEFELEMLPRVFSNADGGMVCEDNPSHFVSLSAGHSNPSHYSYSWTHDGNPISDASSVIQVNQPGTYSVVSANNATGCLFEREFNVTNTSFAEITSIDVADLITDTNTVTVNLAPTEFGVYEFAIDNGYFQSSNVFYNVQPGPHVIHIRDLTACGVKGPFAVNVMEIPRFFTPNGDGFNEYWNIKGASPLFNGQTVVHVYDRYGKLLTSIDALGEGWDGTYNGEKLPADDYWFAAFLENGRRAHGHFTLKKVMSQI